MQGREVEIIPGFNNLSVIDADAACPEIRRK
jgi:hypothetical protein